MTEGAANFPYPTPTVQADASLPFCHFEKYRFHCRLYGKEHSGSLLVLHGGPGGDFRYLLPLRELADGYRIIFYDQRGSGLSPRTPPAELQLEQYLQDLHAFVEHYSRNGPLSLFGHSWGAFLALQYVARHPGKIHKLILAAPFIPDVSTRMKLFLHNLRHGIIPKLVRAKMKSLKIPAVDSQARQDYFFGILLRESNPGYNCPARETRVPMWRSAYHAFRRLSASAGEGEQLERIAYPSEKMLMLAGACDQLLGVAYQQKVRKKLGFPELREIPNSGHYLLQDNAGASLKEISAFLKKGN